MKTQTIEDVATLLAGISTGSEIVQRAYGEIRDNEILLDCVLGSARCSKKHLMDRVNTRYPTAKRIARVVEGGYLFAVYGEA